MSDKVNKGAAPAPTKRFYVCVLKHEMSRAPTLEIEAANADAARRDYLDAVGVVETVHPVEVIEKDAL